MRKVLVVLAIMAAGVLTGCASGQDSITTVTATATETVVVTQTAAPAIDDPGAAAVNGGKEYRCKDGFLSIEAPIGQPTIFNGVTLNLTEQRGQGHVTSGATWESDVQLGVTLDATIPASLRLGSIIVTTGAHSHHPELYGQDIVPLNWGTGTFQQQLVTTNYASNYRDDGITSITACVASAT